MTLPPPAFVNVSDSVCVEATGTLPKLSVVGFETRVPGETPAPESGMVRVGFDAFDVTVTLPLEEPVVGLNEMLKVLLCPAVRITGVAIPLTLNALPLTET